VLGGAACVLVLVLLALAYRALVRDVEPVAATSPAKLPPAPPSAPATQPAAATHQGFLYGRITTVDGATFEGRLRWGGDQEAFWSDYFNGFKRENPWLAQVPPGRLPKERRAIELFGIEVALRERPIDPISRASRPAVGRSR